MYPFRNKASFYDQELLTHQSSPKLENHPLSAIRDCLFNILTATLHIGGRSPIQNLRTPYRGDRDPLVMAGTSVIRIKVFIDQPSDHKLLKRYIFQCSWLFGKVTCLAFRK
jgi:hypothetical protein